MLDRYVGPVGVGTDRAGAPQSIIRVVFDTGSTNLWISSTLCELSLCTSSACQIWDSGNLNALFHCFLNLNSSEVLRQRNPL